MKASLAFLSCLAAISVFGAGSPYVPMYPNGNIPNSIGITNASNGQGLTNQTAMAAFRGDFYDSDFGLKGDGKTINDVQIINSTTIQSATAGFKTQDVGKVVVLWTNYLYGTNLNVNARGEVLGGLTTNFQAQLFSTIASVNAGLNQATLSSPIAVPASNTGATNKMVYGTDDAPAFRVMATNAVAHGGVIHLRNLTYMMGSFVNNVANGTVQSIMVTFPWVAGSSPCLIKIEGKGSAVCSTMEFGVTKVTTNGTILYIANNSTATVSSNACFLSGNLDNTYALGNYQMFKMDNLTILQPSNPNSIDCLGFAGCGGYVIEDCAIGDDWAGPGVVAAGTSQVFPNFPQNTNSVAIRSPIPPSPDYTKIYNCWIWGYGTGIIPADHMQVYGTSILQCNNGVMQITSSDFNAFGLHLMSCGVAIGGAYYGSSTQPVQMFGITFEGNKYDVGSISGVIYCKTAPGPNGGTFVITNSLLSGSTDLKVFGPNNELLVSSQPLRIKNYGPTIPPGSSGLVYNFLGQPDPYMTPMVTFQDIDSTANFSYLRLVGGVTNGGVGIGFYASRFPIDNSGFPDWLLGQGDYLRNFQANSNNAPFVLFDNNSGQSEPVIVYSGAKTGSLSIGPNGVYMTNSLTISNAAFLRSDGGALLAFTTAQTNAITGTNVVFAIPCTVNGVLRHIPIIP